jgi:hypothetical protein
MIAHKKRREEKKKKRCIFFYRFLLFFFFPLAKQYTTDPVGNSCPNDAPRFKRFVVSIIFFFRRTDTESDQSDQKYGKTDCIHRFGTGFICFASSDSEPERDILQKISEAVILIGLRMGDIGKRRDTDQVEHDVRKGHWLRQLRVAAASARRASLLHHKAPAPTP